MSAIDPPASRLRLARLFREQAEGCARLGSPLYAGLLARAADDLEGGGVVEEAMRGHEDDPGPSALALRLAGAVHRLVLEGRAPRLAPYYPSVGGVADAGEAWPAFRRTVADNLDVVRRLLASPPQTNEVGRSAVLLGMLLQVQSETRLPVRLLEIGASAGLNLRLDVYRFLLSDDVAIGPADSPVILRRPWAAGRWPPTDAPLTIVGRRGCDADPADPASDEGRLRLASYVWADQTERLDRLRAACELAAGLPVDVEQEHASTFLARELAEPVSGVTTVVWHSVLWQYLDRDERAALTDIVHAAGRRATAAAPLAVVSFEPQRVAKESRFAFLASRTLWPGGVRHVVAEGQGHGPPVRWF